MSLSNNRNTPMRGGNDLLVLSVAANAVIYAGALVCSLDGYATKGAAGARLVGIGRAEEMVDNTGGSAGDKTITVRRGVFQFANSADADEITEADIERTAYVVDDQTVAKTSNSGARGIAGRIVAVDEAGVWVELGKRGQDRKVYIPLPTVSLKNADGGVARLRSPVAGKITGFSGVNGTQVATADATAQLKIGGVDVTGGLLTWPVAGAAAGQGKSATPTAANTVAVGDIISAAIGGGGTQTGNADMLVEITLA
jgi:hypothetical protein